MVDCAWGCVQSDGGNSAWRDLRWGSGAIFRRRCGGGVHRIGARLERSGWTETVLAVGAPLLHEAVPEQRIWDRETARKLSIIGETTWELGVGKVGHTGGSRDQIWTCCGPDGFDSRNLDAFASRARAPRYFVFKWVTLFNQNKSLNW